MLLIFLYCLENHHLHFIMTPHFKENQNSESSFEPTLPFRLSITLTSSDTATTATNSTATWFSSFLLSHLPSSSSSLADSSPWSGEKCRQLQPLATNLPSKASTILRWKRSPKQSHVVIQDPAHAATLMSRKLHDDVKLMSGELHVRSSKASVV